MSFHSCRMSLAAACGLLAVTASGCWPAGRNEVVVYTAQDEEFAEPLFAQFTKQTGIVVQAKYDSEAAKTTGLVADLIQESERPRADVFWDNEPLGTLRLEKLGLLTEYRSPAAAAYPAEDRSPHGRMVRLAVPRSCARCEHEARAQGRAAPVD